MYNDFMERGVNYQPFLRFKGGLITVCCSIHKSSSSCSDRLRSLVTQLYTHKKIKKDATSVHDIQKQGGRRRHRNATTKDSYIII